MLVRGVREIASLYTVSDDHRYWMDVTAGATNNWRMVDTANTFISMIAGRAG
jgi:hypothetical protein